MELGDAVLAYDHMGPLLYEAKILNMEHDINSKKKLFFVHYSGWAKRWDEWVPEDRVLPDTPSNRQKQKQVKEEFKMKKITKEKKVSASTGAKKRARAEDPVSRVYIL